MNSANSLALLELGRCAEARGPSARPRANWNRAPGRWIEARGILLAFGYIRTTASSHAAYRGRDAVRAWSSHDPRGQGLTHRHGPESSAPESDDLLDAGAS